MSDSAMKTADLHLHTHYSDGTESPQRVVELAKEAGLSSIAITDHDNVDAFPEAKAAADKFGIELITGIEMSASDAGREIHVLGHLIDRDHAGLKAHLAIQQVRRVERCKEMVRRLNAAGVKIDAEEVLAFAGKGTVGRPHIAHILLKHGYIKSVHEAFSKYLGPKDPGFVQGSPMAPAEVIRLILEAGGIPVLAHPIYIEDDPFIDTLVSQGLAGLEVYHSGHGPKEIERYEQIADRLGLLKTGGSDYHGTPKEGVPVGQVKVPVALVEALKEWQRTRAAS